MNIEIPNNCDFRTAVKVFRVKFISNARMEGETVSGFAARMGVSRKAMQLMLKENTDGLSFENSKWHCTFCDSNQNIRMHHIHGKQKKDLIPLCENCHRTFHSLNRSYKPPIKSEQP